jgi:hypothetical protein
LSCIGTIKCRSLPVDLDLGEVSATGLQGDKSETSTQIYDAKDSFQFNVPMLLCFILISVLLVASVLYRLIAS